MNGQDVASVFKTWSFIWRHPIASQNRGAALMRWLRWQLGTRLLAGEAIVPFLGGSRLLVRRGMTGATGNIYAGLHEFEEMAFALHLLRPGDVFVDIGANVGVYTVLAGAVAGATCVAVEPIPTTFGDLMANIHLNGLESRVQAVQVGLGAKPGVVSFTASLDTVNHIVAVGEPTDATVTVQLTTLDDLLGDRQPTLLKVDVEGFEAEVFEGGQRTLAAPSLSGVIVELNGSGARYGFDDAAAAKKLEQFGFRPHTYFPFERKLRASDVATSPRGNNALFVRPTSLVLERLRDAKALSVVGLAV